jgi:hypothetical protein
MAKLVYNNTESVGSEWFGQRWLSPTTGGLSATSFGVQDLPMALGDTADIRIYHNNAANVNSDSAVDAGRQNYLTIVKLA